MKTLTLVLAAFTLFISSAHADNCKVLNSNDEPLDPAMVKILTDHGYTVSTDEDSTYSTFKKDNVDAAGLGGSITTEVRLYLRDGTMVANGSGEVRFSLLGIMLHTCQQNCSDRQYAVALKRALRDFNQNIKMCQ